MTEAARVGPVTGASSRNGGAALRPLAADGAFAAA
jgi:hypothetical protein